MINRLDPIFDSGNDLVVGRIVPLGTLSPPQFKPFVGEAPTLEGVLAALIDPVEQLDVIATNLSQALDRNSDMRCADDVDQLQRHVEREQLLKEFVLAGELSCHIKAAIRCATEVIA